MYWINGLFTNTALTPPGFQAANPAAGVPLGTELTAAFFQDVQGELLNFLNAAGISPEQNTPTQVKAACDILYAPKSVTKTLFVDQTPGSRTYIVPTPYAGATVAFLKVTIVGGGAKGADCAPISGFANTSGAGGGAGAFAQFIVSAAPGGAFAYTVGAGGAAALPAGASVFGELSAGGGSPGVTSGNNSSGGAGGNVTGSLTVGTLLGQILASTGGTGSDGMNGAALIFAGNGAPGPFGGGGRAGAGFGVAGTGPGAGGGGAYGAATGTGGNGANGLVMVELL